MGLPKNDYLRIISKSYGPRKPLVVCEASSLDMLADLDCAEGSTATVGGTEYVLDRVNGWVEPGSGGGGGSDSGIMVVNAIYDESTGKTTMNKTWQEIHDYDGIILIAMNGSGGNLVFSGWLESVGEENGVYKVDVASVYGDNSSVVYMQMTFDTSSADGYPVHMTL